MKRYCRLLFLGSILAFNSVPDHTRGPGGGGRWWAKKKTLSCAANAESFLAAPSRAYARVYFLHTGKNKRTQ